VKVGNAECDGTYSQSQNLIPVGTTMSLRWYVCVVRFLPLVFLILGLTAGCSRSTDSSPKPVATQEASREAVQEPVAQTASSPVTMPPPVATPAPPSSEPVSPSVGLVPVQPAPKLESATAASEATGKTELSINVGGEPPAEPPAMQMPVGEPAANEPPLEPVSPPRDPSLRPNPLRDGSVPAGGAHIDVPVIEPVGMAKTPDLTKPLRGGKHSGERFDPIEANGPIFVGWSKPQLALVISGRQDGYIEPCGCAGLDRMKGGLSRRYSLFRQLREDGWPVVGVDVGGQGKNFGRQAVLKFQMTVEALKQMGYDAVAYGYNDLRLPAGEVLAVTAPAPGQKSPFLSANAALFGFAAEMTPAKRIVEAGGKKIGITAVVGKKYQQQINNPDVEMSDPETALQKVVAELKQEHCDLLVLLAHATEEESIELGKRFPEFKIVVTYGGNPEPPDRPKTIEGTDNLLIEVGEKGMNVVVLGFYNDAKQPIRYQRVPLDSRFANASEMKLLMTNYQTQLRTDGLEGLGLRPVPHPRKGLQGKFVGSQKCESCHESSYKVWKKSGHARAWDTLKGLGPNASNRVNPPRDADPECISCHVVGWHGTQYFPYESGFWSEQETPKLTDVGCESCHGPGEKHVEAEMGSDESLQKKFRQAMVLTKEEAEKQECYTCHDLDNSPAFDFKTYWPYIEHKEE